MTDWLKGCEVCNSGLCTKFDELINAGCGHREAARQLEEEQQEKLGEIVFSSSSLLSRYYRNKPQVFRNETPQESDGEEWPMCSECKVRPVNPNGKGICRSCNKKMRDEEKYRKNKEVFEQTPICEDADRAWNELSEKLINLIIEYVSNNNGGIMSGKVSRETLSSLLDAQSALNRAVSIVLENSTYESAW